MAGDAHGVLHGQAADGVGGGDLAHGLADDGRGLRTQRHHEVGEGDLDGGDADLGGLEVEVLCVIVDERQEVPTGLGADDLGDLGDTGGEARREGAEFLAHLAVLGAVAGVDPHRALPVGAVGDADACALLPVGETFETCGGGLGVMGEDDAAGPAVVATAQGAGGGGQVGLRALVGQPGGDVTGGGATTRGQQTGDRQQLRDTLGTVVEQREGGGALLRNSRCVLPRCGGAGGVDDHDVGVGPAEAEAGDTGDRVAGVPGPFARVLDDLQVVTVEVDVGVRSGEVQRLRQHAVAHGLDDLDDAGDTGGGLGMTEVRLRRAEQQRVCVVAPGAEDAAQGAGLDRVTENRAGAVGLDVVDGGRIDAGVRVGLTQHLDLRLGVRGGQSVGASVLVHGGAGDDAEDVVAVAAGVRQTLEDEDAGPVGADDAVGVLGEGPDAAGRAEYAQFGEGDGTEGVGEDVHATGDSDGRLPGTQGGDGVMDRDEGGGAGRVEGDRGAAEVESVGDAVGDDGTRVAGQRVGVRRDRVGGDEHPVVVVRRSHEHAGTGAAQGVRRDVRVLERLPGQLQQDALLGVHVRGLDRGEPEELVVEGGDVLQVAAGELGLVHAADHLRVAVELAPPSLGQLADPAASLLEQRPHVTHGLRARVAGGHADHGDLPVLRGQCPGARRHGELPGTCDAGACLIDDVGRQIGDRVVLVGDGGVEADAGEPFEVTGQHDDITAGEAELLHEAVVGDLRGVQTGGRGNPVVQPGTHLRDGGGGTCRRGRHRAGASPFLAGYERFGQGR